jgi:hypothetical protein
MEVVTHVGSSDLCAQYQNPLSKRSCHIKIGLTNFSEKTNSTPILTDLSQFSTQNQRTNGTFIAHILGCMLHEKVRLGLLNH